jgi:hypothetical protein
VPDTLVIFEDVTVTRRDPLGFRCRVAGREVWIGNLQWQEGTTAHATGHRLVLRREDAATLGLIDWKPAA